MSEWICKHCGNAIGLGKKGWFHYELVDCAKAEPGDEK